MYNIYCIYLTTVSKPLEIPLVHLSVETQEMRYECKRRVLFNQPRPVLSQIVAWKLQRKSRIVCEFFW